MPGPKYISVNGVLKKNPEYEVVSSTKAPQKTSESLAVISSQAEFEEAAKIQQQTSKISMPQSEGVEAAIEMLNDSDTLSQYKSSQELSGAEIINRLGAIFTKYETPFGLINKLLALAEYNLDFIIDDSYSMKSETDVNALEATEPVKTAIRNRLGRNPYPNEKMQRIEEAEDRLHILMDILALLPIPQMQIRFLNSPTVLKFDRSNKTLEQFQAEMHAQIRAQFAGLNFGGTPVKKALQTGFNYPGKWSHYLFNDGEPSEGGAVIAKQIIERLNPELHALTLISCTNNDSETAWMKHVDNAATYVAEVDDYSDEYKEVVKKQGAGFPFTRGLWLLCQLLASTNLDLDALDENLPLTNFTLSNILGRRLNPDEYQYYFERNPNASLYIQEYPRFLNEECLSRDIISKDLQKAREKEAKYKDDERPESLGLVNISHLLVPTTANARERYIQQYQSQMMPPQQSPATMAPHSSFMPPAPGFVPVPQSDYTPRV